MRIFFDAFELAPGVGKSLGIYRYAKNLFAEMRAQLPTHIELTVACNGACADDFDPQQHPRIQRQIFSAGVPDKYRRQFWLRVRALREARRASADAYFTPKGFLPGLLRKPSGITTVVVIHDLIPLWYSERYSGHFGRLEEYVVSRGLLRSVEMSDQIVAISQATAQDIAERTGRTRGLHVVRNGIAPPGQGPRPIAGDFIFAMTSQLPHKNSIGILDAYRQYRAATEQPLPLVVCGIDDPRREGVIARRSLSESELQGCYQHARVFLFLSLIEGFGFPPLEAMAHGVPVVCSDIAALREVAGTAAMLVDPQDSAAAARALVSLTSDPAERESRAALGLTVAAGYDWASCARALLSLLETSTMART